MNRLIPVAAALLACLDDHRHASHGLEEASATAATIAAPEAKQSFLARMRKFLTQPR